MFDPKAEFIGIYSKDKLARMQSAYDHIASGGASTMELKPWQRDKRLGDYLESNSKVNRPGSQPIKRPNTGKGSGVGRH